MAIGVMAERSNKGGLHWRFYRQCKGRKQRYHYSFTRFYRSWHVQQRNAETRTWHRRIGISNPLFKPRTDTGPPMMSAV